MIERNFSVCPHCALAGKHRMIRPATLRTPLVSRSDGKTYHLFLEEAIRHVESTNPRTEPEIYALFRFDLDPAALKAESALVQIPHSDNNPSRKTERLEEAADLMAAILAGGASPRSVYRLESGGRLVEQSTSLVLSEAHQG